MKFFYKLKEVTTYAVDEILQLDLLYVPGGSQSF